LTHRSVLHDWVEAGGVGQPPGQSNERLEFLGDALLGAIVAAYLYERYPDDDEGTLTAHRVALVRAETLVRWAREIGLGDYLYLGQGERPTEGARDRMLAGAFEALVGASALDQGIRGVRRFLRPRIAREAKAVVAHDEIANPKGRLQELAQERFRRTPVYHLVSAEGPAHARVFTIEVTIGERVLGSGTGASKRDAEQTAARGALATLMAEAIGVDRGETAVQRERREVR
jgi:ribonuclease-3